MSLLPHRGAQKQHLPHGVTDGGTMCIDRAHSRYGMEKSSRASHFLLLSFFTSYPSEENMIHCENVALGGQMEAK